MLADCECPPKEAARDGQIPAGRLSEGAEQFEHSADIPQHHQKYPAILQRTEVSDHLGENQRDARVAVQGVGFLCVRVGSEWQKVGDMPGGTSDNLQNHVHALHEGPEGSQDQFDAHGYYAGKHREIPTFFQVLFGEFTGFG